MGKAEVNVSNEVVVTSTYIVQQNMNKTLAPMGLDKIAVQADTCSLQTIHVLLEILSISLY